LTRDVVRDLRADDADPLHALAAALPDWFDAPGLARMRTDLAAQEGLVAERDGALAGFVLYLVTGEAAEITWMAVARALHRRGIGSALCGALEGRLRDRRVAAVEVSTLAETIDYAPYEATRAFYRRRGFEPVRVDPAHWGPGNDRLLLRKRL